MFKKFILAALLFATAGFTHAVDVRISALTDTGFDPAIRGGEITYVLSVLNTTNDIAKNTRVVFPVPATTSFVRTNNPLCTHAGTPGVVTCELGDLTGNGFNGPFTNIDITIKTGAQTTITVDVSALITADEDTDTNQGSNNYQAEGTTIGNGADLAITVSDSPDPVIAGGEIIYTLNVTNKGPDEANEIILINTLPAGVVFERYTGTGWSCTTIEKVSSCELATIASNATTEVQAPELAIVGKVVAKISGTVTNTTSVSTSDSSEVKDPYANNNQTTTNTLINLGSDLSIIKTVASPVIANTSAVFTLQPRNHGPINVENVKVIDVLPSGFSYQSYSSNGWTCSASGQKSNM